jgi:hypothetical protein
MCKGIDGLLRVAIRPPLYACVDGIRVAETRSLSRRSAALCAHASETRARRARMLSQGSESKSSGNSDASSHHSRLAGPVWVCSETQQSGLPCWVIGSTRTPRSWLTGVLKSATAWLLHHWPRTMHSTSDAFLIINRLAQGRIGAPADSASLELGKQLPIY